MRRQSTYSLTIELTVFVTLMASLAIAQQPKMCNKNTSFLIIQFSAISPPDPRRDTVSFHFLSSDSTGQPDTSGFVKELPILPGAYKAYLPTAPGKHYDIYIYIKECSP